MTDHQSIANGRRTALLVGSILLAMAAWSIHKNRPVTAMLAGTAGAVLVPIGLLLPAWALRFHTRWMRIGAALGYVNGRVLLFTLFFTIITVLGFIRRLLGKDPLDRRSARRPSYWVPRSPAPPAKGQVEHLF